MPEHAAVRVPAPFVFGGFLLLALLLHWLLPLSVPAPHLVRAIGAAAVLSGLILGVLAALRLLRTHTTLSPHQPTTTLVTDGPFRYTRNPIYLGFLLIYLGFTVFAGTLWGVLLSPFLPIAVDRLIIGPEEQYLASKFNDHYLHYRSRVRRWI